MDHLEFVCSSCGARNRVNRDRVRANTDVVCGRCKTPLAPAGKAVDVTDANFSALVEQAPIPVLLDLWAPWCGPCRMVAPVIDELARDYTQRVRVAKLNVDQNPATASRFRVQGIPALILFRGGVEVERMVGAQPKLEIGKRLERLLA